MQYKSKYKLALFDLDGTLLDGRNGPPQANIQAIKDAKGAGIIPVMASGRCSHAMELYADQLDIADSPLICLNGMVQSPRTKAYRRDTLFSKYLPEKIVREILEYARGKNNHGPLYVRYFFHDKDNGDQIIHALDDPISRWHSDLYEILGDADVATVPSFDHLKGECALKLSVMGDHDMMDDVEEEFQGNYGNQVNVVRAFRKGDKRPSQLEIMCLSKAEGINYLSESLGIPPHKMVAFGDSDNDIEMMQAVGLSIAMENATDKAKAAATHVTRTNNSQGGVAEGTYEFVLTS